MNDLKARIERFGPFLMANYVGRSISLATKRLYVGVGSKERIGQIMNSHKEAQIWPKRAF